MRPLRADRLLDLSERAYGRLLRLYPIQFRWEYGAELRRVFRDDCAEGLARAGYAGVAAAWWRVLAELVPTLVHEHCSPERAEPELPADYLPLPAGLTPRARRSLSLAVRAAALAGAPAVTGEHLLAGLYLEPHGAAGRVLRREMKSPPWLEGSDTAWREDERWLTRLLRAAEAEAERLGHAYVGTEHLLLAHLAAPEPEHSRTYSPTPGVRARLRRRTLRMIGALPR